MNRLPRPGDIGFTLVEMLVSVAILVILVLVLSTLISGLRIAIAGTSGQVSEFGQAREAFETMTRRIGQATLNSYDDVDPLISSTSGYSRASELRFKVGNAQVLISNSNAATNTTTLSGTCPTEAIFFHAPLGYTNNTSYAGLLNLINTVGYFVQWNSDASIRPGFLPSTVPVRYRMRLMELLEPAENVSIYNYTSGPSTTGTGTVSWSYTGMDWFLNPLSEVSPAVPPVHAIAENVIFLAFLPMVAPQNALEPPGGNPDGTDIDIVGNTTTNTGSTSTPPYDYDSSVSSGLNPDSLNRLPPIVWVMMIAVDEKSFSRWESTTGGNTSANPGPALGLSGVLANASYSQRTTDVAQVTNQLIANHINYRIYTAAVPLTAH